MKYFPTEGPVVPGEHYCIPPLERWNSQQIVELIARRKYFVLHAPRQTGKTSTLLALRDLLNEAGDYRCVYANLEGTQFRQDEEAAMRVVLGQLALRARLTLGDGLPDDIWPDVLARSGPGGALAELLARWSAADPKPLVLLLDEVDTMPGPALVSLLRQIRSGYDMRSADFPQSVLLCGVRDVRDYRIQLGGSDGIVTPGSAFNIKAESVRMGDFSEDDIRALLGQHTEATGQVFTDGAIGTVRRRTLGQPWLVNALAFQACFRNPAGRDRARSIDARAIVDAQEELILRRETHLDQLAERLREDRVRRVIEPMLSGDDFAFTDRDLEYVRDLGLVALDAPVRIANPIYREVVPRQLVFAAQEALHHETAWYVAPDGSLNLSGLLEAFQDFYRGNSEHWVQQFEYREAGPQLLMQAFLQRIVNGGGRVEREYPLGRRRTDLMVEWPRGGPGAPPPHAHDRHVIELKVRRAGVESTIARGLEQTADYMDRCGATDGHLVIFDRDANRPWEEKLFRREEAVRGRAITVWGM